MESNNLPTAEEFINSNWRGKGKAYTVQQLMVEFAKLHVQAALKEASEKAETDTDYIWNDYYENEFEVTFVDKASILNAYPLDNIK